jgi:hypothetical protein
LNHLVSIVSARARGKLADLDREKMQLSFDTRVIVPTMLAKHFAPLLNEGGSIVLFSGVNASKVNVGYSASLSAMVLLIPFPGRRRSSGLRSASTPSHRASSTPAHGTQWATISHRSAP